jgi:hypothetical protein
MELHHPSAEVNLLKLFMRGSLRYDIASNSRSLNRDASHSPHSNGKPLEGNEIGFLFGAEGLNVPAVLAETR